ncbi:PHP domain-containing protein, partial [Candidatus Bathyarchaeota archaeon]|nr:PHP domain-containing protein [Candidatus Bathyarchaeota archaeon]
MPLKIDFHVHTCYSGDCSTSLRDVISYSKKKGLDGVVITDHNTVEGALKLQKNSDNERIIIPGIEVSTNAGHILGINVTTPIP